MSQKFEKLQALLKDLFQFDRMIADLEALLRQHISKQALIAVHWAVV